MSSSEQREVEAAAADPSEVTSAFQARPLDTLASGNNHSYERSSALFSQIHTGMVLGQYRILERLGAGGMGQVYKAIHPTMDRIVALKVVAPELMKEDSARARFQREVRNAARLIHPHIVVAHDAAEVEGLWFLVMEYIEGRDLSALLQKHGRPPVGLACEIIRQAALGLQYAHERGMVHRDIKPANVIVADSRPQTPGAKAEEGWCVAPLVKILDFGLSRMTAAEGDAAALRDAVTREGYMVGTPEYMSPEQVRDSQNVDIRSDIYSLGCTLYALLAARPPFRGLSSLDIATQHITQTPEPVAHYCPGLPPPLSAVIHRMLAKRPEERIQTPGDVAVVLQPWTRLGATYGPVASAPALPSSATNLPIPAAARHTPRSRTSEPTVPPAVLEMHFQALVRMIFMIVIIAALVAGCVLFLPDIGNFVIQAWNRLTPHSSKTISPR